jgi:hypothetical protein
MLCFQGGALNTAFSGEQEGYVLTWWKVEGQNAKSSESTFHKGLDPIHREHLLWSYHLIKSPPLWQHLDFGWPHSSHSTMLELVAAPKDMPLALGSPSPQLLLML